MAEQRRADGRGLLLGRAPRDAVPDREVAAVRVPEGVVELLEQLAVAAVDLAQRVLRADDELGGPQLPVRRLELRADAGLGCAEAHPVARRPEQLGQGLAAGQHERDRPEQRRLARAVLPQQERPLPALALGRGDPELEMLDRSDVVEDDASEEHRARSIIRAAWLALIQSCANR